MVKNLIEHLPYLFRDYAEFQGIIIGQQPELDGILDTVETSLENQFVTSADSDGLKRWEDVLGITPKGTATLSDRRFDILARWNQDVPYSIRQLRSMLEKLCGVGNYEVTLTASYTLTVKVGLGAKNEFQSVVTLVERVAPCNLVLNIYQAYTTWNEVKAAGLTWGTAKAKTWLQLREEEVT